LFVAHATLGGCATDHLGHECGEVAGGALIAVQHQRALVAAEHPFGQAQFGFHHTGGNRTFGPRRVPVLDPCQLPSAVARFARPDEYASFEFSAHHGATVVVAWFHHVRRLSADHGSDGVS
jgi:hypothetical protein